MPRNRTCVQRIFVVVLTVFGIGACTVVPEDHLVPVAVFGISSSLQDADLKATAQTRDLIERALSNREGFLVRKEFGRAASYTSLKELIAAQETELLRSKVGMMVAVSRERTVARDLILFHVFGGPTLAKHDIVSVEARNLNTGVQRVAQLVSGYGHIIFDVSTLPPRTEIYVDDQPFKTTDDNGRFRETFTWPAGEYKIKFVAWISGTQKEKEDTARVKPKKILHFRKHINLQH